jgi:hypothetical protein
MFWFVLMRALLRNVDKAFESPHTFILTVCSFLRPVLRIWRNSLPRLAHVVLTIKMHPRSQITYSMD